MYQIIKTKKQLKSRKKLNWALKLTKHSFLLPPLYAILIPIAQTIHTHIFFELTHSIYILRFWVIFSNFNINTITAINPWDSITSLVHAIFLLTSLPLYQAQNHIVQNQTHMSTFGPKWLLQTPVQTKQGSKLTHSTGQSSFRVPWITCYDLYNFDSGILYQHLYQAQLLELKAKMKSVWDSVKAIQEDCILSVDRWR